MPARCEQLVHAEEWDERITDFYTVEKYGLIKLPEDEGAEDGQISNLVSSGDKLRLGMRLNFAVLCVSSACLASLNHEH